MELSLVMLRFTFDDCCNNTSYNLEVIGALGCKHIFRMSYGRDSIHMLKELSTSV